MQELGRFAISNEAELIALATRLEVGLTAGDVLGLIGELGVGKSLFARAIISAAKTRLRLPQESIPSPSFSLMQFYPRPTQSQPETGIWHVDAWRLDNAPAEAEELGLGEALVHEICLIEWADKLGDILPASTLFFHFSFGATATQRHLTLTTGSEYAAVWGKRLAPVLDISP